MPVRALPRRRLLLAALTLVGVLALALAPGAWADAVTPDSGGSPNADDIDTLYKITLAIAIVIFLIVEGSLFYCLFRYRARKGRVAAQIHGNTNLEIGWTVGAALILVVLATVTFVKLGEIGDPAPTGPDGLELAGSGALYATVDQPKPPAGEALYICVSGRQYIWRYTYSRCAEAYGKPYSYEEMVAPADTTVILEIEATDVMHSWWIPTLGGKMDAVPGYRNYAWFKAPTPGTVHKGQCAELCGRNHPDMTARVRVVTPAQYESYVSTLRREITQANRQAERTRRQLDEQGDL